MTPNGKPHATPRANGGEFTNAMRYELLGEDERPLLSSYGISAAIGAVWLSLVFFGPATQATRPFDVTPPDSGVVFVFKPLPPMPADPTTAVAPPGTPGQTGGTNARPRPVTRPVSGVGASITSAFVNGGAAAKEAAARLGQTIAGATMSIAGAGDALRNVEGGPGGKVALGGAVGAAHGAGQSGAFAGGSGVAGTMGAVGGGHGSGVGLTPTVVADPVVVTKPAIPGNARDVADVGQVVRSYSAQLQSCYEREGLKQNPSLAGTLTAAITISGAGRVTGVDVTRRTWSGPGADDAERCIVSTIKRWRFSPSSEAEGTYSFPFSFTK